MVVCVLFSPRLFTSYRGECYFFFFFSERGYKNKALS